MSASKSWAGSMGDAAGKLTVVDAGGRRARRPREPVALYRGS